MRATGTTPTNSAVACHALPPVLLDQADLHDFLMKGLYELKLV
jgi:hypothetical protein